MRPLSRRRYGEPNYEAAFTDGFYDDLIIGAWRMMSIGAVLSSPVVDAHAVYFGSADGNVYAVD
jgi:outer membrane protein assembly factor BamB